VMSPEETSAHDDNNMRLLNADEERRRMSPGFFLEEEDVGVVVADMGGGCGGTTTRKGHPSNDVDENAIAADGSPSPGGTRRRKPSVGGMTTRTDATRGTSSTITEESLMLGGGMGGGNVWTRFLSRRVTLWDKLETTSGMNVDDVNYDDVDGDDDDDSREGMDHDPSSSSGCKVAVQTCVLTMWYEAMHFGGTIMAHPRILLMSTIAFGLVCGLGIAAVVSMGRGHVQMRKNSAHLKARGLFYASFPFPPPLPSFALLIIFDPTTFPIFLSPDHVLTTRRGHPSPNMLIHDRRGRRPSGSPTNSSVRCYPYTRSNRA
jgi:hypothetical protein